MRTLADRPAIVPRTVHPVNRLPERFRDAADEQIAVAGTVEGDAEGIAETPGVNLGPPGARAPERVGWRDRVAGRPTVDVDPQDFAVEEAEVLGIAVIVMEAFRDLEGVFRNHVGALARIGGVRRLDIDVRDAMHAAAVAKPDIEKAVRAEGEAAAIMLAVDPIEFEENALRAWLRTVRVGGRQLEFGNPPRRGRLARERRAGAGLGAVGDVKQAIRRKIGMKRHPKQPALVEGLEQRHHGGPQVEKRRLHALSRSIDNIDLARLLADEAPAAAVVRGNQEDRRVEPLRDKLRGDFGQRLAGVCGARLSGKGEGEYGEKQDPSHRRFRFLA